MASKQIVKEQTLNQIKGTTYEIYIKSVLLKDYQKVYRWSEIPMNIFIESGLYNCYNDKRLFRKKTINQNPISDTGCDILYFDNTEWILVQCKDHKSGITMEKIAGFAIMLCSSKLKGELYHTSQLSKNLNRLTFDRIKFIKFVYPEEEKKVETIKLIPYDYQIDAYNSLKNKPRSILQLPCGMGKTLISTLWGADYDLIIIFSPLKLSAQQNFIRFKRQLPERYAILVDSDGTRHVQEISKLLLVHKKLIMSVTYKSTDVVALLLTDINRYYKKIGVVIDEFHNLTVNHVSNNDDNFNKILMQQNFNFLFVSATARVYDIEDSEIDVEDVIGKIEYKYDFREAIDKGYICDNVVFIPDITINKDRYLYDIIHDDDVGIDDCDDADNSAKALYILRGLDENGYSKCISYCKDINDTKLLKNSLILMNKYHSIDLQVRIITSETSTNERDRIIKEFTESNGTFIICSVHILDEAIDVVPCDSVFISCKCQVKNRLIQRICRSNRKDKRKPNKISGIFLWCNEYDEITGMISSFKEFDDGFTKEKIKIIDYQNENKICVIERKKEDKKYIDLDKFIISVRKLMSWNEKMNLLFEYCDKNNTVPIRKTSYKDFNIGQWLPDQKKNINTISDEIYKKLSVNKYVKKCLDDYLEYLKKKEDRKDLSNEQWITLLLDYCKEHKCYPIKNCIYKNYFLGSWFSRQKNNIKDTSDDIYKILSNNEYLKISLDKNLEQKEKNKNKIKMTRDKWITLIFEYCYEKKCYPMTDVIYKNFNLGRWFFVQKTAINNIDNEMYKTLSKNIYLKENLDEYLKNKDNVTLTFEEYVVLLFEYCDEYDQSPPWHAEYKTHRLGTWYQNQKKNNINNISDKNYKILSLNKHVKKNLDEYLLIKAKNKEKITDEDKKILLFEYCNENKICPSGRFLHKNQPVGMWFEVTRQKINDTNDEIYKELSKNEYIKKNLDDYLKKRFSDEEKKILLFEYCNENKTCPSGRFMHKNCPVGRWLQARRAKIDDESDEEYKELSKNQYVKKNLDKYLKDKETNKFKTQ